MPSTAWLRAKRAAFHPTLKARGSDIASIADKLAPEMRRRFLAAMDEVARELTAGALASAIASEDIEAIEDLVDVAGMAETLRETVGVIKQAFAAAAEVATERLEEQTGLKGAFVLTNPRAVKAVRDAGAQLVTGVKDSTKGVIRILVGDGIEYGRTPAATAKLIKGSIGLTERQATAVSNYREKLIEDGKKAADVERLTAKYAEKSLNYRAKTIAVHETSVATHKGQREAWEQAAGKGLFSKKETTRVWSADPDACDEICAPMDEQEVAFDDAFETGDGDEVDDPPAHVNCLPGDAFVTPAGRIAATTQRWYQGDMLVIRTADGHRLACTPNHPILSDRGWIPAKALNIGGYVISQRLGERRAFRDDDHQDMPASIEEIAQASQFAWARMSVPMTAPDFHGDGRGSQVAVVRTDRALRDGVNAARCKHQRQATFGLGDAGAALRLNRQRPSREAFLRYRRSGNGAVRGRELGVALGWRHARPLNAFLLRLRAQRHAGDQQLADDRRAHDAQLARDIYDGAAGLVLLDEIVDIYCQAFIGHVFNLETSSSAYIANGIVNHNCRCSVSLSFDGGGDDEGDASGGEDDDEDESPSARGDDDGDDEE